MSYDLNLRDNSVSRKSFLKSVMSNISRSIDKVMGNQKINYEEERNKFS